MTLSTAPVAGDLHNLSPVFETFAHLIKRKYPERLAGHVAAVADHLSAAISGFDGHRNPPCHLAPYSHAHLRSLMLRATLFQDEFAHHQLMTNLRMSYQIKIQENAK